MATYPSEFTIEEVINKVMAFNPIGIYWNNECIWNDDNDVSIWNPVGVAFLRFYETNPYYKDYMVTNINISATDYHHTIVHIYGYNRAAAD